MSNYIPQKDLEEGLRIIQKNVESLIDTATLLNSNKKFLHSAIFSILAIEEIAKAQILFAYHRQKNDILLTEWNRITRGKPGRSGHLEKMTSYLRTLPINLEEFKEYPEITAEKMVGLFARYYVRLKVNVLYVNWDKRLNKWYWLPDHYSEDEQKIRSDGLLLAARKGYEKYPVV